MFANIVNRLVRNKITYRRVVGFMFRFMDNIILFPLYYLIYKRIKKPSVCLINKLKGTPNIYSLPEALVAPYLDIFKKISRYDVDAVFLGCYDFFRYCPSKAMLGLGENSSRFAHLSACNRCSKALRKNVEKSDILDVRFFEDRLSPLQSGHCENLQEVPISVIAKLSDYDVMIGLKKDLPDFDHEAIIMKNAITADSLRYISFYRGLLKSKIRVDNVYFFDHYSSISSTRNWLTRNGIKNYSVYRSLYNNASTDLIKITRGVNFQESLMDYEDFKAVSSIPLRPEIITSIVDELLSRQQSNGTHIYSLKKSGCRDFDVPKGKKVIVAFNSSNDELRAFEEQYSGMGVKPRRKVDDAFDDQFEWLKFLIDKVESSEEYYLIIRIHPRLYSNHREGRIADDYYRYKTLFGGTYKNTKIIWPEDEISAYDLFEIADVASASWTSIPDELARMGVKTVCGITKFIFNYDNVNIFKESSKDEFWKRLMDCAEQPASIEDLRFAYRVFFFRAVGQFIKASEFSGRSTDSLRAAENLLMHYESFSGSLKSESEALVAAIQKTLSFLRSSPPSKLSKKLSQLSSVIVENS